MICEQCGKEFEREKPIRFCSASCKNTWISFKREHGGRKKRVVGKCGGCGCEIVSSAAHKKYCSRVCYRKCNPPETWEEEKARARAKNGHDYSLRKCEICGSDHNGLFGGGRFCSKKCACSRPQSDETKNRISKSVKDKLASGYIKIRGKRILPIGHPLGHPATLKVKCPYCGKENERAWNRRHIRYCNPKCSAADPTVKAKISAKVRTAHADGRIKPWKARKRTNISYPEQFTMGILNQAEIAYEHEKKVGKYFIDFAIEDKMVALEIDGSQHDWPERKQKDQEKDAYLTSLGWSVVRIKWIQASNEEKRNGFIRDVMEAVRN